MKNSVINFGFLVLRACVLGVVAYCAFNPSAQLLNLISVWFWLLSILCVLCFFGLVVEGGKVEGMSKDELCECKKNHAPDRMIITKAIGWIVEAASLVGLAACGFFFLPIVMFISIFLAYCAASGLRDKIKKRKVELNSPSKFEWE